MHLTRLRSRFSFRAAVGFIGLLLILTVLLPALHAAEVTPEDLMTYFDSLEDAKVATQNEISRSLLAIVPKEDDVNLRALHGGRIIWEGLPGTSRVLVSTFMDWDTYNSVYKPHMGEKQYPLEKSLWVTVVPELQNRFIGKDTCPPSTDRVVKLIGLNPAKTKPYEVLVEMWVEPRDLFRPTADPEITDHEAALPTQVGATWVFPDDMNPFAGIKDKALYKDSSWQSYPAVTFRNWYEENAKPEKYVIQDYNNPNGWPMPWTRLGYTYDWGSPDNHVGLSEFILRIRPKQKAPSGNMGVVRVGLRQAVDSREPGAWDAYFRCQPILSSPEEN